MASAYRLISRACVHDVNPLWLHMWHLDCPNRIKLLLWKCLSNAVPTCDLLNSRIGGYDPSCLLCQEAEESLEHLTLKCPFSWVVWLKEIGGATQSLDPSSSFLQWSSFISNLLGSSNCSSHLDRRFFLSQVANFIWAIWKERNGVLFEGSLPSVLRACQYVSKLQNDSLLLQKQPEQCSEQKRSVQVIWRKPAYPYVKINFDGAYRYHSKEAAIGGIARDSQGRFIAAFSSTVEATSSIQAEAFAALEAIRLAVAL